MYEASQGPPQDSEKANIEIQDALLMMEKIRKGEVITTSERLYQSFELACATADICEKLLLQLENGNAENTILAVKKSYDVLCLIRSIADMQKRPENPADAH